MSTNEDHGENDIYEGDPELDALIRSSRKRGEESPQVPSETVHAYLTGTANAEEKTIMRHALAASAEFRAQVLKMAAHLMMLQSPEAEQAYESTTVPAPQPSAVARLRQTFQQAWQRITETFSALSAVQRLTIALPAAAAVVLLLVVGPRFGSLPVLQPTITTMDPGSFSGATTRGGPAASHLEAAEMALETCVLQRDGALEFVQPTDTATLRLVNAKVRIVDTSGKKRKTLRDIPLEIREGTPADYQRSVDAGDAVAWLLLLPDEAIARLELQRAAITHASFALDWSGQVRRAALTVTYATESGYVASPCVQITID